MYYDVIKSLHLVSVISWMVGLLYLPRLFVYHYDMEYQSQIDKTFLVMEVRLLKIIMQPAMALTYLFGILLIYENSNLIKENYFLLKLFLVLLLTFFHVYLSILYKDFKKGYRFKSSNFYRKINEIPTFLMILIIFLIIIKPNLPKFIFPF
ncbi:protoporphyrinogen oxidase HemJ [Alphaproteobacteria bacterium]|nr:protoporphyrinogen oxidase HemJ [Alphaproteobacteria bacterium]